MLLGMFSKKTLRYVKTSDCVMTIEVPSDTSKNVRKKILKKVETELAETDARYNGKVEVVKK